MCATLKCQRLDSRRRPNSAALAIHTTESRGLKARFPKGTHTAPPAGEYFREPANRIKLRDDEEQKISNGKTKWNSHKTEKRLFSSPPGRAENLLFIFLSAAQLVVSTLDSRLAAMANSICDQFVI